MRLIAITVVLVVAAIANAIPSHYVPTVGGPGNLYSLKSTASNGNQLQLLAPSTAKATNIGSLLPGNLIFAQQVSTFDSKNGLYWTIALDASTNKVVAAAISVSTGQVTKQVPLPLIEEYAGVGIAQTIHHNPNTQELIITGFLQDQKHHLLRVNTLTGKVRDIAAIGNITLQDVLGAASSYDWVHDIVVLQFADPIYFVLNWGIDASTGAVLYKARDTTIMECLVFDAKYLRMCSIGLIYNSSTDYVRILVAYDAPTGQQEIIGEIPGYFQLPADICAIDFKKQHLYAFMSKSGSLVYELLTIRLLDAAILSNPAYGTDFPWGLEFYN